MPSTTALLVRYNNRAGFAGKLLGEVTLSNGTLIHVWDQALHQECKRLSVLPGVEVTCEYRTSTKWGHSLTAIKSTKTDYELLADLREQDEKRGSTKSNSYIGQRIAKRSRPALPAELPVASVDVTQANTVTPEDHDRFMGRVG